MSYLDIVVANARSVMNNITVYMNTDSESVPLSEQDIPEQDISEQNISEQDIFEQDIFEEDMSEEYIPEQDMSEEFIPELGMTIREMSQRNRSQLSPSQLIQYERNPDKLIYVDQPPFLEDRFKVMIQHHMNLENESFFLNLDCYEMQRMGTVMDHIGKIIPLYRPIIQPLNVRPPQVIDTNLSH